MSTTEVPPAAEIKPVEIPLRLPTIDIPEPTTIHFRVLIHGEVDVDIPSNTDQDELARLIANDIKAKCPTFKIIRLLKAIGRGPVATPF